MTAINPIQRERRRERRRPAPEPIRVRQMSPVLPVSDAEVLDVSRTGVALWTRVPLKAGDRLSFSTAAHLPPILAEVLEAVPQEAGWFRVRCQCLLGAFDAM